MLYCKECGIIQDVTVLKENIVIVMEDNTKVRVKANKTRCTIGHDLTRRDEKKMIVKLAKRKHRWNKIKARVTKISVKLVHRRK